MLIPFIRTQLTSWGAHQPFSFGLSPRSSLILLSAAVLFFELMIIRIQGSFIRLLAVYKNVTLLSCFLGFGIGLVTPKLKAWWIYALPAALAIQVILLYLFKSSILQMLLINPSGEYWTMGMMHAENAPELVVVHLFMTAIFLGNALCFIPFGNLLALACASFPPLAAYGYNLLGSLLGVLLFTLISALVTPPSVWLGLGCLSLVALNIKNCRWLLCVALPTLITLMVIAFPFNPTNFDLYSPYQQLTIEIRQDGPPAILVNNFYYQRMLSDEHLTNTDISKSHYALPYLMRPEPQRVLVVGSGTGNDVASGLLHGATTVDAIEIDPVIVSLGKVLHPLNPYSSPQVNLIVADARSYPKQTSSRYDLIVYGLLDSHSSLAGQGGLRLDSYVYTVEALREMRTLLKEDGVLCLSFATLGQQFLIDRLAAMLTTAFDGMTPYIYKTSYDSGVTFCAAARHPGAEVAASRNLPPSNVQLVATETDLATDDWPFLLLKDKHFPSGYFVTFLFLFIGAAILLLTFHGGGILSRDLASPFFLGAGSMLLETKAITELALLYGSTWLVVAITIAAVLTMGWIANYLSQILKGRGELFAYLGLIVSIFVSLWYTTLVLPTTTLTTAKLLTPIILTLPLLFSGYCFSNEAARSPNLTKPLAANVLGAMLGGMLEYNVLQFGLRSLYLKAAGLYGAALLGRVFRR